MAQKNKPISIYLADLTYTTLSLATEAFPLNIGFVAAYADKQFGKEVNIQLFKYFDDLDQAIRNSPPDILGMSNYPWNFNAGLQFFNMTKALSPNTVCVMGGPNIPLDEQARDHFILKNNIIDFYCYLEGEAPFSSLVERRLATGPNIQRMKERPVEGIIHRYDEYSIAKGLFLKRREALDDIPSPYLSGFMDKFFDGKLTPLLETNRGCPFSCTYCHEGSSLISKVNFFSVERVKAELDYCAQHVPKQVTNLMFADPNFGMYERDLDICDHISKIQSNSQWPRSIFASTGKNKKERIGEALRKLNGTMKLWMSVQSMDHTVLKEIKRGNIKLTEMMGLAKVFEEMGLPTYSEIILALPGETYDSHIRTIASVVESGIDIISTYTLMLLNGTELTLPKSRDKYGIKSHFRVLPRDFGLLSTGLVAVEIEEVVTSTNTLSFDEYLKARRFHLIVNAVYNGKGFGPLFKFFGEIKVPIFSLLSRLIDNVSRAPESVQNLFTDFTAKSSEELWDSEDSLREYVSRPENYERLLVGELGANLIQTHTAKSMQIMDDWAHYIFEVVEQIAIEEHFNSEERLMLNNVRSFCMGRVHNIWGDNRTQDNPVYSLDYDIHNWYAQRAQTLKYFKLHLPSQYEFRFTDEKNAEINNYIQRFGKTDTGIGRILTKMNLTSVWRRAFRAHSTESV